MNILKHGLIKFYESVEDLIEEDYYPEGLPLLGKRAAYVFGQGEIPSCFEVVRKFENGWHCSCILDDSPSEIVQLILNSPDNVDVSSIVGDEIE